MVLQHGLLSLHTEVEDLLIINLNLYFPKYNVWMVIEGP